MKTLLKTADKNKLNEAVVKELTASNMYKYFSTCTQRTGYFGASAFFLNESKEELEHWKDLADFMNDRGDEAEMGAIPAIDYDSEGLKALFEHAFQAEAELEEFYTEFYASSNDDVVKEFLLKFIKIQRKAVGEYGDLLATLERCEGNPSALLIFDSSLK